MTHQMTTTMQYKLPNGVHEIPHESLDLRPDHEIDDVLVRPAPVKDEKNIWLFWDKGFTHLHNYTKRNVRTWHRRFSRAGWTVRVLDLVPDSPLNVANFLDVVDPDVLPIAFRNGSLTGTYAAQHFSDLVRLPLLLKHGGVYVDVGMMPIGDLDALWEKTIGDPKSPYEVLSYNHDENSNKPSLTNYFMCSGKDNALFKRCHRLLLALWNEDGGKTSTEGMHTSPLLRGLPLMGEGGDLAFEENGRKYDHEEVSKMLTDYIIQGQVMDMVMRTVDNDNDWDGPKYTAEHVYAIEFMGAQLINDLTNWNGREAFRLMSLRLPEDGEAESEDQALARKIVESCLQRSFGFKLAHGLIVRVMGDTLGSLWRKHEDSDAVPGTFADWLRYGTLHWCQNDLPPRLDYPVVKPVKVGPLLKV